MTALPLMIYHTSFEGHGLKGTDVGPTSGIRSSPCYFCRFYGRAQRWDGLQSYRTLILDFVKIRNSIHTSQQTTQTEFVISWAPFIFIWPASGRSAFARARIMSDTRICTQNTFVPPLVQSVWSWFTSVPKFTAGSCDLWAEIPSCMFAAVIIVIIVVVPQCVE
jgi:hypothetical protein